MRRSSNSVTQVLIKGAMGFTIREYNAFVLIELLIVVLIICILAALAIPKYIDATEQGRAAEAITNLGSLRRSELEHYNRTEGYTKDLDELIIENPNLRENRYFDYEVAVAGPGEYLVLQATRRTGRYHGRAIRLDEENKWSGDWKWIPGPKKEEVLGIKPKGTRKVVNK